MKQPTWPKSFAYIGLAVMGLTLAYYSSAIANGGIAARMLGTDRSGDVLTLGSAFLMVGIAMAAVFAFLAVVQFRRLTRKP